MIHEIVFFSFFFFYLNWFFHLMIIVFFYFFSPSKSRNGTTISSKAREWCIPFIYEILGICHLFENIFCNIDWTELIVFHPINKSFANIYWKGLNEKKNGVNESTFDELKFGWHFLLHYTWVWNICHIHSRMVKIK